MLGLPVTYRDQDFAVVAANDTTSGLAFQRAPDNQPPTWPDPAVPQQFHLDIMVEDVAAAVPRVLELGAVKLNGENVYADPAGHRSTSSRALARHRPSPVTGELSRWVLLPGRPLVRGPSGRR